MTNVHNWIVKHVIYFSPCVRSHALACITPDEYTPLHTGLPCHIQSCRASSKVLLVSQLWPGTSGPPQGEKVLETFGYEGTCRVATSHQFIGGTPESPRNSLVGPGHLQGVFDLPMRSPICARAIVPKFIILRSIEPACTTSPSLRKLVAQPISTGHSAPWSRLAPRGSTAPYLMSHRQITSLNDRRAPASKDYYSRYGGGTASSSSTIYAEPLGPQNAATKLQRALPGVLAIAHFLSLPTSWVTVHLLDPPSYILATGEPGRSSSPFTSHPPLPKHISPIHDQLDWLDSSGPHVQPPQDEPTTNRRLAAASRPPVARGARKKLINDGALATGCKLQLTAHPSPIPSTSPPLRQPRKNSSPAAPCTKSGSRA